MQKGSVALVQHQEKHRKNCASLILTSVVHFASNGQIRVMRNQAKKTRTFRETTFGFSSYLADRHRSFYDRDFGADRYAFEAYGGGCCYCDDDSDDDDDSYGYSDDDCSDCCGDSGDNS